MIIRRNPSLREVNLALTQEEFTVMYDYLTTETKFFTGFTDEAEHLIKRKDAVAILEAMWDVYEEIHNEEK